ncbi:MAG: DNA repair protein RecO [Deltaproteobacteria bacterium]|nr:DNA repair protein RecO [Deltaproteobacteria bacterium]
MATLPAHTLEGIIIRAHPSGESDLVLRIICRDEGKISAMAKHARTSKRRYGSRLDLFDRGSFELKKGRGSLLLVDKFSPAPAFRNLRDDLARLTIASVICESFDYLLLEGAGDGDDVFSLLNSGLEALDQTRTLKESLRACHTVLGNLLTLAGFLDPAQQPEPSAKNLFRLLQHLETCSEKELQSKASLIQLVESLRAT